MFFASKIRGVAEHFGFSISFVKSATAATETARKDLPDLLVADLHSQRCDPLAIAKEFKTDTELGAVPLVGFFSHVDMALGKAAQEAGYDRVMPRSAFSANLPKILNGEF